MLRKTARLEQTDVPTGSVEGGCLDDGSIHIDVEMCSNSTALRRRSKGSLQGMTTCLMDDDAVDLIHGATP